MNLSQRQREFIREAVHRWNFKIGAVRSGKSYVDIAFTIPARLREGHGKDGLNVILGVSRESIERNVLQPMREIYTDRLVGRVNGRNIAYICGEEVYCLGAEKVSQVSKIQGSSIKYCYGDEIAKWNQEVFTMLKSRLDKPYSCFDGACNPEFPNHWVKQFIDTPDLDIYTQKYTIFDNPFLDKGFVDNLCKEYAGTVYYQRYILGEWALAEGLIYPMFKDAVEEPPEERPEQLILSLDYGTQNAFAALLWGKFGDVWYAVDEYYYSGRDEKAQKTDEEYAQDLDEFVSIENQMSPLKVIIDPSAASFIALLRKRQHPDGSRKYRVQPADNAVLDGIRETATAMQTGKIKISPKCKKTRLEADGYVWDEKSTEDKPVKEHDHAMDAMRYFVKTTRIAVPKQQYRSIFER